MLRAWGVVVALVSLASCVKSNTIECGDGRTCPANTTCDVERGLCLFDGQLEECANKGEGDACAFGGVAGVCYMGLCTMSTCGDNRIGPGEACDDGNLASNDGCRGDCRSDETCGNGVVDFQVGEDCDCGAEGGAAAQGCDATNSMTNAQSTCRTDCKLRCGDDMVQPGEVCDGAAPSQQSCIDYGFDMGLLGCSDVCAPAFLGCTQFGWVPSETGLPNADLRAIWGASANSIFAVGTQGLIVHWDGTTWSKMTVPPTTSHLYGVWGRSATDVYAAGSLGTVIHYDGSSWSTVNTGMGTALELRGVTGDANNVYIAGGQFPPTNLNGVVLRLNSNAWTFALSPGTAPFLNTVVINAARSEVYAAGELGSLWRAALGSTTWGNWASSSTTKAWYGSFAAGSDVYVVGELGLTKSTNGGLFIEVTTTPDLGSLRSIWGTSASNMFVLGDKAFHYDGSAWTVASEGFTLNNGAWGTAIDDVWSVGFGIRHFQGTTWSQSITNAGVDLNAISAGTPGVFAVGEAGTIVSYANGVWSKPSQDAGSGQSCGAGGFNSYALKGVSVGSDLVVAIGAEGTVLYASSPVYSMFYCANTVGQKFLLDIWAIDSNHDVFAVGIGSQLYRRRIPNTDWTAMPAVNWLGATPVPLPILQTMWGFSDTDIWAGGANGTVVHWNGTSWNQVDTGAGPTEIVDIWGLSPTDVYAVGSLGHILHYNGTTWTQMDSGVVTRLEAIWGTAANDLFVIGGDTLLHYDGANWTPVRDATLDSMHGIVGKGPHIFGVGTAGGSELLLRY